jgi:hypothetical protein
MPDNIYVWIAAIVVLGLVVVLALWLGRGLKINKSKEGYSLEVEKNQPPDTRTDVIKVAEGLELKDAEAGDIAGRKATSPDAAGGRPQNIEVANRAKIERAKVGDIVGSKQEGPARTDEEKKE